MGQSLSIAIALAYLLYPVIFNVNLFDFHPEVMALPALLGAILAARLRKLAWFCLAITWILGCKAVLSLTIIALGFWLFWWEQRRIYGSLALAMGCGWFILVTQVIIPGFSGEEVEGIWRYTYLGNSVLEIITNLILKPQLVLGRLFSMPTLDYFYKLSLPVIWWISPQFLVCLVPALPTLLINSLSDVSLQRSLAFQYSLPVIPFLFLGVIFSLNHQSWMLAKGMINLWRKIRIQSSDSGSKSGFPSRLPQMILLWSLLIFFCYGKYGRFWGYLQTSDTWKASEAAVAQVEPFASVLTDNYLSPHLTHRANLKLLSQVSPETDWLEFDYIVLNLQHPWPDTETTGISLVQQLENNPEFKVTYQNNDVMVFKQAILRSPL